MPGDESTESLGTPSLEEGVLWTSDSLDQWFSGPVILLVTPPLFIQSPSQMGSARCKYEAELCTQVMSTEGTQLNTDDPKSRPRPTGLAPALSGL